MKITLDTTVLDANKSQLIAEAEARGYEVVVATVTERERGRSDITDPLKKIPEVLVLAQSPLGVASLASDDDADTFEHILLVISDAAFPAKGRRNDLTDGERHQLRDAMAFTSHVRDSRDIFVTDDKKGFIKGGRRECLESRYRTRIMETSEFREHLRSVSRSDAYGRKRQRNY